MVLSPTTSRRIGLVLAFACFIALGIVNGLLGVAWPSIRGEFGLPLDALVFLLASSTLGFVLGSVLAAKVMARLGVGSMLLFSNILAAVGLFGFALVPGWWILVGLGVITGWASGAIDTALNIYVAATRSVRTMNWMHASFGIGATLGPLIMTVVLGNGISWRMGYVIAALVHLVIGVSFLAVIRTMTYKGISHDPAVGVSEKRPIKIQETLKMPIVWMSILLFLLYTGVESTSGQWTYTWFTESRGVPAALAGLMTSIFWAMLTLGRIVFGAAATRIGVTRLLNLSMVGTILAAILLLFPSTLVGFVAIALMGLSLSAIFPTLTSDTPHRVGRREAANTIGLQTGAASIGFAILPGIAGSLAERAGLEILGPFLVITSISMWIVNLVVDRLVKNRALARTQSMATVD